ncbi:hypothetical protein [Halorubrum ruber]|uniref:Dnd system-associated protein 4 n=1 Tax=Halorubrum ruber TaxID=2982524 RepID=A0A8T8LL41_9EURY|nr:hypothetical protein [Halorubrum ruber]QUO47191.1 hypothetical protein J7656_11455 [Halorubrum ruber]
MGRIINYKKTELYDTLVDEYEVFENYYDLLIFLAVIGYKEDNPVREGYRGSSSEGTAGESGLHNVYSQDLYRTIMASLAFQDTGDPEALVDEQTHMKVLAQYAAGGLEIAEDEFGDIAGDPTDAIINYIKMSQSEGTGTEGELAKIVQSFDDEMMNIEGE